MKDSEQRRQMINNARGGLLILDADAADALEPLLAEGAEGQRYRRVDSFNFVLVDEPPSLPRA